MPTTSRLSFVSIAFTGYVDVILKWELKCGLKNILEGARTLPQGRGFFAPSNHLIVKENPLGATVEEVTALALESAV